MTKIYTINTLEVYANSQHIDAKVGEPLSLVVDIKINWVDQSSAQRILFYQWEQSLDRGVSWTQIFRCGAEASLTRAYSIINSSHRPTHTSTHIQQ